MVWDGYAHWFSNFARLFFRSRSGETAWVERAIIAIHFHTLISLKSHPPREREREETRAHCLVSLHWKKYSNLNCFISLIYFYSKGYFICSYLTRAFAIQWFCAQLFSHFWTVSYWDFQRLVIRPVDFYEPCIYRFARQNIGFEWTPDRRRLANGAKPSNHLLLLDLSQKSRKANERCEQAAFFLDEFFFKFKSKKMKGCVRDESPLIRSAPRYLIADLSLL